MLFDSRLIRSTID